MIFLATFSANPKYQESSLQVGIAYLKADALAEASRILQLSKDLEEIVNELQQKESAYNSLALEYHNLSEHNQPLEMLKPAMERVEDINHKNNLETLEKEVEDISQVALKAINFSSLKGK